MTTCTFLKRYLIDRKTPLPWSPMSFELWHTKLWRSCQNSSDLSTKQERALPIRETFLQACFCMGAFFVLNQFCLLPRVAMFCDVNTCKPYGCLVSGGEHHPKTLKSSVVVAGCPGNVSYGTLSFKPSRRSKYTYYNATSWQARRCPGIRAPCWTLSLRSSAWGPGSIRSALPLCDHLTQRWRHSLMKKVRSFFF